MSLAWIDTVLDFALVVWVKIEAFGGFMKVVELALLLGATYFVGNRLKRALTEFQSSVNDSMQLIETRIAALKGQVGELADVQNDQFVTALDVPPSQQSTDRALDEWHRVRDAWADVRSHVEQSVWSITDGRVRRKYTDLDWRNYTTVLDKLRKDNILSGEAFEAASELQRMFNSLRLRQANVTKQDGNRAHELAAAIKQMLSKSENEGSQLPYVSERAPRSSVFAGVGTN